MSLQEAEEEDGNLIVNRAINYYARYMEAPPLTAICLQSGGKLNASPLAASTPQVREAQELLMA